MDFRGTRKNPSPHVTPQLTYRGTCNSGGFHSGEFIPSEGGKILRVQSGPRLIWCFVFKIRQLVIKMGTFFESLPFIIIFYILRRFFFSKNGLIEQNILLANFMLFSLFCWQDGSNTDILDLVGSCIADIVQQVRRQSLSSRLIRTAAGLKLWGDDTLLRNCKLTSK